MSRFTVYIFIYILFSFSSAFAAWKPARIADKDGFTYVRKGAGSQFDIIGKILVDDFFYCEPSDSDWWMISQKGGLQGYTHKSKIVMLESLSFSNKKKLFLKIFREVRQLADSSIVIYDAYGNSKWKSEDDSLKLHKAYLKLESFEDKKFIPVIEIFQAYFCDTKDSILLNLYLGILWVNRGSVNEIPGNVLGECFYCNPELVSRLIKSRPGEEYREFLDFIRGGLENTIPDFEKSTNPKISEVRKKLNELNSK